MGRNEHILSWDNGHLTQESLHSYNEEALSRLDMHKVERHILNCELCSDALDGFASEATK